MQKSGNFSDRNMAVGLIIFAFVKAYQDSFIYNLPKIVKMAYEGDFLLRYALFFVLLSVYGLFPYLFLLSSYFIFNVLKYNPYAIDFVNFYIVTHLLQYLPGEIRMVVSNFNLISLLQSVLLTLYYIIIRYLYPNTKQLTAVMASFSSIVFMFSHLYSIVLNFFLSALIAIITIAFPFLFITFFDNLFKLCHFVIISHCVIFGSPKNWRMFSQLTQLAKISEGDIGNVIFWPLLFLVAAPLVSKFRFGGYPIYLYYTAGIFAHLFFAYLYIWVVLIVLSNRITK